MDLVDYEKKTYNSFGAPGRLAARLNNIPRWCDWGRVFDDDGPVTSWRRDEVVLIGSRPIRKIPYSGSRMIAGGRSSSPGLVRVPGSITT